MSFYKILEMEFLAVVILTFDPIIKFAEFPDKSDDFKDLLRTFRRSFENLYKTFQMSFRDLQDIF